MSIIIFNNQFNYQEIGQQDYGYTRYVKYNQYIPEAEFFVSYLYCNSNIFLHEYQEYGLKYSFKEKIEDIQIAKRSIGTNNKFINHSTPFYIGGNYSLNNDVNYFVSLLPLRKISNRKESYTYQNDSEYHKITTYKIDFSLREKQSLLKKIKTFLKKVLC
jgi:hypothetical protein